MGWFSDMFKEDVEYKSAGEQDLITAEEAQHSIEQARKDAIKKWVLSNSGADLHEYLSTTTKAGLWSQWEKAYRFAKANKYSVIGLPKDTVATYQGEYYPVLHFMKDGVDVLAETKEPPQKNAKPQIEALGKAMGIDVITLRDKFKESVGEEWTNFRLFITHFGVNLVNAESVETKGSFGEIAYLYQYIHNMFYNKYANTPMTRSDLGDFYNRPYYKHMEDRIQDAWSFQVNKIYPVRHVQNIAHTDPALPQVIKEQNLPLGSYATVYTKGTPTKKHPFPARAEVIESREESKYYNTTISYTLPPSDPYDKPKEFSELVEIILYYQVLYTRTSMYCVYRDMSGLYHYWDFLLNEAEEWSIIEPDGSDPARPPYNPHGSRNKYTWQLVESFLNEIRQQEHGKGYSYHITYNRVMPIWYGNDYSEYTAYIPYFPIDRKLLGIFSNKEKEALLQRSLRISWVHNKTVKQYRNWVEPLVEIGVYVITAVYTAITAGADGGSGTAALLKLATTLAIGFAINKAVDFAIKMGWISPKMAEIIKIVVTVVMMAKGTGWDFSKILTAPNIMKAVNASFEYMNKRNEWEIQELQKKAEEHQKYHNDRMAALQAKQKMADLGVATDPSLYLDMPSFAPTVDLFETPEMMYARHYNFNVVGISQGLISNLAAKSTPS